MNFQEKIKAILAYYKLTPNEFSDKINIQRSSISHFLSGRNKPSLDFLIKLTKAFPDFNTNWFLTGEGFVENITNVTNQKRAKKLKEIIKIYNDGSFEVFSSEEN